MIFDFIDPNYTGEPFQLFGPKHLLVLFIVLAINLWLLFGWKKPTEKDKRRARYFLAAILFIWEAAWHLWSFWTGTWTITYHLPLHVCSIMVWLSIFMLLSKNYRIYEFAYFIGFAGALQPLLTPEAGIYGLWHFRAIQTLIVHGTLVIVPIYMTTKEGFRPTWGSFLRVAVGTNLYMILIHFINLAIGSNYLFTVSKPPTASLLDVLGPWPLYLLSMEAIGFIIFFLLYLPFMLKDIRRKRATTATI
ncbi:MAG: TIGR02206 family membrane protein [Aliifodinibius sp.]|nr:TIGR02206 family membrane protein [Fodinibius sp.]